MTTNAAAPTPATAAGADARARWLALLVLCLGDLMIVLDGTIVNVALPSIRDDLGFDETSLAWVANAYLLTFGGFLLLGGRLGDIFGQRRMFLIGIVGFTAASVACGLSTTQGMLVVSRAAQGLGGALVSAVALSLLMTLFTEPAERAKAMGIFGFVLSGGGAAGVMLGGILTDLLSWHWIFLVNVPVGIVVFMLSLRLLPAPAPAAAGRIDWAGAISVTGALVIAVYAIVNGNDWGWGDPRTLGLLGTAAVLLGAFLVTESRTATPLVPLRLFRIRSVSTANGIAVLMSAGLLAWFFFSALYLQQILGYTPLEVGLVYLPSMIVWGGASIVSDRVVMRFGILRPLVFGLGMMAIGLLLFARTPVDGSIPLDVIPGTLAIGLGAGIAFNPLLLAAMSGVGPAEFGLASGVVNTSFMMGGAVGLAILASVAASRTDSLEAGGDAADVALNGGYHAAFLVGAIFVLVGIALAVALLRGATLTAPEGHGAPEGAGQPATADG
jgi:EmrB/QacA subfamily drug resistance transporter